MSQSLAQPIYVVDDTYKVPGMPSLWSQPTRYACFNSYRRNAFNRRMLRTTVTRRNYRTRLPFTRGIDDNGSRNG